MAAGAGRSYDVDSCPELTVESSTIPTDPAPEDCGISRTQLREFYEDIWPDLETYCNDHLLGVELEHVCRSSACQHEHHEASGVVLRRLCEVPAHEICKLKPLEPNMHVVVARYVKPRCREFDCCYAALLNRESMLPALWFFSHSWNDRFDKLVEVAMRILPEEEATAWICSFAIAQNRNISAELGSNLADSPFARALSNACHYSLILGPTADALTRSWCGYEAHLALEEEKLLEVWPTDTTSEFLYVLKDRVDTLDVRKCVASNKGDHKRIMDAVAGSEDQINKRVRSTVDYSMRLLRSQCSMSDLDAAPSRAPPSRCSTISDLDDTKATKISSITSNTVGDPQKRRHNVVSLLQRSFSNSIECEEALRKCFGDGDDEVSPGRCSSEGEKYEHAPAASHTDGRTCEGSGDGPGAGYPQNLQSAAAAALQGVAQSRCGSKDSLATLSSVAVPGVVVCHANSGASTDADADADEGPHYPSGVENTFRAFCGSRHYLEGRSFAKLCKDSGLLDRKTLSTTDVDLIFAKVVPKGSRHLDLEGFMAALRLVSDKRGLSEEQVHDLVAESSGPKLVATKACAVRFHDDKGTYTGTHVHGGPDGGAKGRGSTKRYISVIV